MDALMVSHGIGQALVVQADAQRAGELAQLGEEVLPFPHPQVVDVLGAAEPAEGRGGQFLLLLLEVVPEVQETGEVRVLVPEPRMLFRGELLLVGRSFARVLDGQRSGEDHDFADAAAFAGFHDHPAQPRVHRQLGELLPDGGQSAAVPASGSARGALRTGGAQGAEFAQERDAVVDGA
ncbi:hypothetical protein D9M72_285190 [compost metagenome]